MAESILKHIWKCLIPIGKRNSNRTNLRSLGVAQSRVTYRSALPVMNPQLEPWQVAGESVPCLIEPVLFACTWLMVAVLCVTGSSHLFMMRREESDTKETRRKFLLDDVIVAKEDCKRKERANEKEELRTYSPSWIAGARRFLWKCHCQSSVSK